MRLAVTLLLIGAAAAAAAQVRTIPAHAKRGEIRHVQGMLVEIDGKPQRLSAGAQIRDADNRLVVPMSVMEKLDARYLVDGLGNVHRVWILTAQERAEADRNTPPKPKPPAAKKLPADQDKK
jgi:hypothetical protein